MNFSSKSLVAFVAIVAVGLGSAAGCGGEEDGAAKESNDSGASSSGGSSGSSSSSTSGAVDAGPVTSLPSACEGACAQMALTLTRGADTVAFTHAQFGFYADGSLHIEQYVGGARACPVDGAPTPDQTSIVTIPFPVDDEPFAKGSDIGVGFLDFKGNFGGIPSAKVSDVLLTPHAAAFARDEESGFFAYDLDIVYEGGMTVKGHSYAEYCASMDDVEEP